VVNLVSQVYISEIARPELRGRLSAGLKIFGHLGLMASFLMGAWLDWRQLALVCACAPLMLLVTVQYTPETPSYLVYTGRIAEAEKSLQWLKGGGDDVTAADVSVDLSVLQANIRRMREQGSDCKSILVPQLFKPVLLTSCLMFFNRFSGASAFNFYAVTIFSQVFAGLNPHLVAVITAAVQLLASMASGVLADKLGRRPLLIIAGLIMAIMLTGFGLFIYLCDIKTSGSLDWLPLMLILVFECASNVGIQPISWLMVGELFPLGYRAAGTSLTTAIGYAFAFLGVKTFVDLCQAVGLHGTFWTYSCISVLGCLFYAVCLPETRERPLHEMEVRREIMPDLKV
jgi:facilitated trehalose transporter